MPTITTESYAHKRYEIMLAATAGVCANPDLTKGLTTKELPEFAAVIVWRIADAVLEEGGYIDVSAVTS